MGLALALNKDGDIVAGRWAVMPLLLRLCPHLQWQLISRARCPAQFFGSLAVGRPLRQTSESAGPDPRAPSLVRLRPATRPLAQQMHTPPTPLGQIGAVGADLRGRLEEDPVCEEGAGAGKGPESGEPRDREERRDAGPGLG